MKTAIILHGRPSKEEYYSTEFPSMSNSHWIPWLQKQLLNKDIFAATPEVPLAYEPLWERWVKEVERCEINRDTILVGHSCGGGFWVRYLSENKNVHAGKLFLVAPWIDVERVDPNHFFEFDIDNDVASRTAGISLYNSIDDVADIQSSVTKLRNNLKDIKYQEYRGRGHFTHKYMPSDEFPELLADILS